MSSENFARRTWPQGKAVAQAGFSPDGRRVAVSGTTEFARVYDAETGALLGEPLAHPAPGVKAGWLDDRRLATFDAFSVFRIWDTTSGQLLSSNAIPKATGFFSGRHFIALRPGRAAELWDAATGQRRFEMAVEPGEYPVVRADLRHFLSVRGREVRVRDAETGADVHPKFQLDHSAWPVALNADSTRVAVRHGESTVAIWNPATGRRVAGPLTHTAAIRTAAFTADGRVLATVSADRSLRLWDAATGEPLGPPLWHPGYVMDISIRADGRSFATAGSDGSARVWEVPPFAASAEEMARIARRLNGKTE